MTGNLCCAALPQRWIKAWNSWWLHVSCNIQKKYFSHYLFQTLKNHRGVRPEWFSVAALSKKKLTRLTQERVGVDRSRLSLIVVFWRGKQRKSEDTEGRGWLQCGWCCGDNKWRENGLPQRTGDPPPQATTHSQASTARKGVSFQSKVREVRSRDMTLVSWQVDPHHRRLFVNLKKWKAQEAKVLRKTLPSMVQRWETYPPSLLLSHDAEGSTHTLSQTSSQSMWEMKDREGCCVYTCTLSGYSANCKHRIIDGTQVPGLRHFNDRRVVT